MTPDEIRECLALLGWSQRGLASMLDMDERQVRRWASGQADVPSDIAGWLHRMADTIRRDPPPAPRSRTVALDTLDRRR